MVKVGMGQNHGVGRVVLKQFQPRQGRFGYLAGTQPGINQQAAFIQRVQV